jgi:ADP-heptose:LPS heptosyltransferase
MGNTLFLTPLIAAIHEKLPDAAIDVLSGYPDAADILRGLAGLRTVLVLPHKGWWHLRKLLRTLKSFRAQRYDLVIDPSPNSSSGRLALLLCRARWRLGFAGPEQWLQLDCAVEQPTDLLHEALRPLALLREAFGHQVTPGHARLRIANSSSELQAGARILSTSLEQVARRPGPGSQVIAFFASARDKKNLGAAWWRDFWHAYSRLAPDTVPLEVLPTANHARVDADIATVHCASPRQLAATIAHADWFLSADTGPMHLASATGVPTIAFFERTDPAIYGPLKPDDVILRIDGMTPQRVAEDCARIVAASTRKFATAVGS